MPEIAEVARIVHFLRLHLVGKRIASASAVDDSNVFGKAGTTAAAVEAALTDNKIVSAGNQGKYFWITLEKPPHLVMHFGMTGWLHVKGEKTAYTNYYKKLKDGELEQWPPKYWKFHLSTHGKDAAEAAFTDARRFGRVRLVDCPGADIRKYSPLKENGPDPVIDTDRFTEEFLRGKMKSRHVPVKALLLDQAVISGIGNWVADETLFQAKLHPEQYSDTFADVQIKQLYESIRRVCQTAVDKLGDSDEFPKDWLFNYRWGKGSKGSSQELPNGEKLAFITVGGRTSCYAPGLQKKTGHVVPGGKVVEMSPEEKGADKEEVRPKVLPKIMPKATGTGTLKEPPSKKRKTDKVKKEKDELPGIDVTSNKRRSTRLIKN